jgi:hypothetical protein
MGPPRYGDVAVHRSDPAGLADQAVQQRSDQPGDVPQTVPTWQTSSARWGSGPRLRSKTMFATSSIGSAGTMTLNAGSERRLELIDRRCPYGLSQCPAPLSTNQSAKDSGAHQDRAFLTVAQNEADLRLYGRLLHGHPSSSGAKTHVPPNWHFPSKIGPKMVGSLLHEAIGFRFSEFDWETRSHFRDAFGR